jgi:tetratricopeptide (TPR) repeat protein
MPHLPFNESDDPSASPSTERVAAQEPTFGGETVVFTGKLWSLSRKEARTVVEQLGGSVEDDVTLRTTLLVLGGATYPSADPDEGPLPAEQQAHSQKLRRAVQVNADQRDRIRIVSEDAFCRRAGLPSIAGVREKHHAQRDVLTMYPALREDHLRYLQKWGLIRPVFKNHADTFFGFGDLTLLRQVHAELQQGLSFRAILRELQATRAGQLAFDFRIDAEPARIISLKPRQPSPLRAVDASAGRVNAGGPRAMSAYPGAPISPAEQYFLMGSLLDDGPPEQQQEAARAYRRALEHDPDLVAAVINLANIHYGRDELAEAQALYERAIVLDPTYFEAQFNLGNIHHDHRRYTDAEACYRAALALNPGYPDAHFYLAVTLEKMGRSNDARQHWREYRGLAPDGEWVELAREFSD